ncbi:AraC family transcriptional regulator [Dysgonomonas sp. 520]|uniref:helix-turn-helix domain-containing protein n=1 Tax=Dysgonomonas sp. 520 TaxID=2302931 RepID=UPI0013D408EC|nr:helix-turn-helix domain-containing protein [Dysgonomonas sp. 520]NDW09432.1 helix-turn-helix domain-containing protein [Dysgonomonas sp. 520]
MKFLDQDNPDKEKSEILFHHLQKGEELITDGSNCKIILITEGRLHISSSAHKKETVSAGKLVLVSSEYECFMKAIEQSTLISFALNEENHLFSDIQIEKTNETEKRSSLHLSFNEAITAYVKSLRIYKENNIDNHYLTGIKVKELVCILKASYTQHELSSFLSTYITADLLFSEQVKQQSRSIKNVRELAERMNYSYSGFNKKFRKVFGVSAYLWLRQQRANMVYYEIYHTNKSLKQISTDNKFCTLSHFNEFCNKILGNSPRKIRNGRQKTQTI